MVRFGLYVPPFGPFGDPHVLVDLARAAERGAWDGVFLWDHIKGGDRMGPLVDPWVSLTAMAMCTRRVSLGPLVTPLPRRRPAKLARETVTLDRLSGGRLILGVGIGAPREEDFADFGDAPDANIRAAQLDEGLEVLTALWTGHPVDHHGEHYTARGAFLPPPLQRPRIPIWVGGRWPGRAPFRRAARWDGVFPIGSGPTGEDVEITPETLADIVACVASYRSAEGPFDVATHWMHSEQGERHFPAADYEEAGATWLLANIGWPPDRSLDYWRGLILDGPPH
jgi:alkanesulfonate monooxygenase SsuD/methylene tetrahydromethanopterin reductase-like flavin-dependent oxidoreductase (luciferase family)